MEWLCSVVEASSVTSAAARLQSGVCLEQLVPLWHFGGGGWAVGGGNKHFTAVLHYFVLLSFHFSRAQSFTFDLFANLIS